MLIIQNSMVLVEISIDFSHHMLMDRMWAAPVNLLRCGRCTQSAQIFWSIPNVIKGNIHSDNMFTPTLELVPNVVFAMDSRTAVNNNTGTPDMENQ